MRAEDRKIRAGLLVRSKESVDIALGILYEYEKLFGQDGLIHSISEYLRGASISLQGSLAVLTNIEIFNSVGTGGVPAEPEPTQRGRIRPAAETEARPDVGEELQPVGFIRPEWRVEQR